MVRRPGFDDPLGNHMLAQARFYFWLPYCRVEVVSSWPCRPDNIGT